MEARREKAKTLFQGQKFTEAIKEYQAILDEMEDGEHEKDKIAVNLGLCYFKLENYDEAIRSYKQAVRLNPNNSKAHYRLFKEYEELQNSQSQVDFSYQIFIHAANYLKKADSNDSTYAEASKLSRKYKKFSQTKKDNPQKLSKQERDTFKKLCEAIKEQKNGLEDEQQQIEVDKYVCQWLDEWSEGLQDDEAKWDEVRYIATEFDPQYGINLAYLLLNNTKDLTTRQKIKRDVCQLKQQIAEKRHPYSEELDNTETEGESIADSEFYRQKYKKKTINDMLSQKQETLQKITSKYPSHRQQRQQPSDSASEEEWTTDKDQLNINPISPKTASTKQQEPGKISTVEPIIQMQIPKKAESDFQQIYSKYASIPIKPKDLFAEIFQAVVRTLRSNEPADTKRKILKELRVRYNKKLSIIIKSFSDNQQKLIVELLSKCGLEELCLEWAPNVYKL